MSGINRHGGSLGRCFVFLMAFCLSNASQGETVDARVLTRNLYIGADPFAAIDVPAVEQIPFAAGEVLAEILASDFPGRARLLADEIQRSQPHAIGLQEVFILEALPQAGGEVINLDYLALLLAELEAKGQHYDVAVSQTNLDLTLPVFLPVPGAGTLPYWGTIRDRDVILVRHNIAWANPVQGYYSNVANSPFPPPYDFAILRGWVAVDLVFSGTAYRFVNTHLEVENLAGDGGILQTLQAMELLGVLDGLKVGISDLPEVVVGDFNSDPDDPACSNLICLAFGLSNPYDILADPASVSLPHAPLTDIWTLRRNHAEGNGDTCCRLSLDDAGPGDFSRRVDLIWTRGARAEGTTVRLQGDALRLQTESGLFASDHLGVLARTTLMPAP